MRSCVSHTQIGGVDPISFGEGCCDCAKNVSEGVTQKPVLCDVLEFVGLFITIL